MQVNTNLFFKKKVEVTTQGEIILTIDGVKYIVE